MSLGKPTGTITFGDLADIFVKSVLTAGSKFSCIQVLFDIYYKQSKKSGTRTRRGKKHKPVRRIVDSRDVPLPSNWNGFLKMAENKANLAKLLSSQLIVQ